MSQVPTTEPVVPNAANFINLVAIPIALITVVLTVADIHSPIRVWLTVLLFVFGAGSGLIQFVKLPDAVLQVGLIIGLSVSIDILVGQTLLAAHNISGAAGVCILAGITCIRPLNPPAAASKAPSPSLESEIGQ